MPMQKNKKPTVRRRPSSELIRDAHFSYTKPDDLEKYITEQGSIFSRARTGLSQKLQRRLARSIKHARHLAMLPFTQTL